METKQANRDPVVDRSTVVRTTEANAIRVNNDNPWSRWILGALAAAALVIVAFFALGGDADVDVESGNIDVEAPSAAVDVDAPDIDVEAPDVDIEGGDIDIDEADAEAEAG